MKLPKRVHVFFRAGDPPLGSEWEVFVHCSPDYRRIQAGLTPCGTDSGAKTRPQIAPLYFCLPEAPDRPCEWQIQLQPADTRALMASPCGEAARLKSNSSPERACCHGQCPGRLSIELLDGRLAGGQIMREGRWHPMFLKKPDEAPPPPRLPKDLWPILRESFKGADLERIHASIARAAYYHVARLAEMFQVSERQLERIHHQAFGDSPKAWLERYRIAEARGLVHEGFRGKECAEPLGFSHPSHFCRWYRGRPCAETSPLGPTQP